MDEPSVRAVGWARSLPMGGEVKAARDWAREHLNALGWTRTAPETADAVLLTVSELVTNAHKHAHSNAQLTLSRDDNCLHISVHDTSAELPARRSPGLEGTGGAACSSWTHWPTSGRAAPVPTASRSPPASAGRGGKRRRGGSGALIGPLPAGRPHRNTIGPPRPPRSSVR
ncbi:hypothetical protein SHIRM173S_05933 [Streptomyces hirsutus]